MIGFAGAIISGFLMESEFTAQAPSLQLAYTLTSKLVHNANLLWRFMLGSQAATRLAPLLYSPDSGSGTH